MIAAPCVQPAAAGQPSGGGLAHAPEWFTIIRKAYGHQPLYLSAEDDDGCSGILPSFIVRRPLFGTVVSSMPFLDSGGPCSASPALSGVLVDRLLCEARRIGARAVDLRSARRLPVPFEPMEHKVNLTLALPDDPDRLWGRLNSNVRRRVRKAASCGLSVEFGGVETLDVFYPIFTTRMRELGSPVHDRAFFTAIFEAFGARARVAVVQQGTTPVGGLVALSCGDTLLVPWVTCLKEYFSLYPNMLLYWELLRTACTEGFSRFDFGRSTRDSGTYRFKRQWGAQEEPIFWYTIPLSRDRSVPGADGGSRADLAIRLWQRLPLPLTRRLGPRIRKYLIQ